MKEELKYGYDFFSNQENFNKKKFELIEKELNIQLPNDFIVIWQKYDLTKLKGNQVFAGIASNIIRNRNEELELIQFDFFHSLDNIIKIQEVQGYEGFEYLKLLVIGVTVRGGIYISCAEETLGKVYSLNWERDEVVLLMADTLNDYILQLRYILPNEIELLFKN